MQKFTLLLVLTLLATTLLLAQAQTSQTTDQLSEIPKKIYLTKRITGEAPVIDGRIEDPAWQAVAWGGDFSQMEPNDGGTPVAATQFKILYDEAYVYVAYRMHDDEPQKVF